MNGTVDSDVNGSGVRYRGLSETQKYVDAQDRGVAIASILEELMDQHGKLCFSCQATRVPQGRLQIFDAHKASGGMGQDNPQALLRRNALCVRQWIVQQDSAVRSTEYLRFVSHATALAIIELKEITAIRSEPIDGILVIAE